MPDLVSWGKRIDLGLNWFRFVVLIYLLRKEDSDYGMKSPFCDKTSLVLFEMEYPMENVLLKWKILVLETGYVSFYSSAISEESYQN